MIDGFLFLCYNIGKLSERTVKRMPCENIIEMIGREWVVRTLRLCGAEARECDTSASDYEIFRALCRVMPLLSGHRLAERVSAVLKSGFGINFELSPKTCDEIWTSTADRLLQAPMRTEEIAALSSTKIAPVEWNPTHRIACSTALSATSLAGTGAESFDAWMREIEGVIGDAAASGCKQIFFLLPEAYIDRRPDVYHVDLVLHKPQRDKEDIDLLHAQLMRVLAQLAQQSDMQLIVRVECGAVDAVALLDRVEREVGLPTLVWTTAEVETRNALIAWSEKPHANSVFGALTECDYPSKSALLDAVGEWAVDYPIGRLRILTQS